MKRRSKLFLIVSGIVFGVGALLCLIGYIVCAVGDESLFAEKLGEDRGYVYYFKDGDLDILKLSVEDADINIIGGSKEPRIELLNFNENLYSFENTAAMVTFKQSSGLSSTASFWDGGFIFKGLRYFLHSAGSGGRGCINVYLNDDEYIKVYDLSSSSGKITVSDIGSESDFQIKAGSGGVFLSDIGGASTVNITVKEGAAPEISADALSAQNINITAAAAKLSASELSADSCVITQGSGSAVIEFIPYFSDFTVEAYTVGKLRVNGESYIDSYKYPDTSSDSKDGKKNNRRGEGKDAKEEEEKNMSSIVFNPARAESDASLELKLLSAKENTEKQK